jgi:hypothetical protein
MEKTEMMSLPEDLNRIIYLLDTAMMSYMAQRMMIL